MIKTEEEIVGENLASRISNGDVLAEAELIKKYQPGLYVVLLRLSRDRELVDDVVQNTWCIVLEKLRIGELSAPHKVSGFIMNTAKYQLIMENRKSRRFNEQEESLNEEEFASSESSPDHMFEKVRTGHVIRKVVEKLPKERDRELIRRFYLDEESREQLCNEYDLSSLHFNRVLFRARNRFKELWLKHLEKSKN